MAREGGPLPSHPTPGGRLHVVLLPLVSAVLCLLLLVPREPSHTLFYPQANGLLRSTTTTPPALSLPVVRQPTVQRRPVPRPAERRAAHTENSPPGRPWGPRASLPSPPSLALLIAGVAGTAVVIAWRWPRLDQATGAMAMAMAATASTGHVGRRPTPKADPVKRRKTAPAVTPLRERPEIAALKPPAPSPAPSSDVPIPSPPGAVRLPEVLSPAGGWDSLKAAVSAGADAVYFGVEAFNARARAENFQTADLPAVMAYLHERHVRGYLTVNVLVFPGELSAAAELLVQAAAAGVDAIIVQDVGLACLARHVSPGLELHASTQMSITSAAGVAHAADLGCALAVLARELKVADIARIRSQLVDRQLTTRLEAFVHGALCVAFSGQCLTSESLGQRSANRGECAQACRLPYSLVVDGVPHGTGDVRYLLSPQDFFAWELLPQLVAAGVDSLKIEGRLKSPLYVAATTEAYRQGLERIANGSTDLSAAVEATRHSLGLAFSRGLHPGWLGGVDHRALVDGRWSKKRGPLVGALQAAPATGGWLTLPDTVPLKAGDGVVLEGPAGPHASPFDAPPEVGGRVMAVRAAGPGLQAVRLGPGPIDLQGLEVGAPCWLTSDMQLEQQWRQLAERPAAPAPLPLDLRAVGCAGQPLEVTATLGPIACTVASAEPLAPATATPLGEPRLREQLGRLGGSGYALRRLDVALEGALFLPVSALNRLRRALVARLDEARTAAPDHGPPAGRTPDPSPPLSHWPVPRSDADGLCAAARSAWTHGGPVAAAPRPALHVLVRGVEQLRALLPLGAAGVVQRVYLDIEQPKELKLAAQLGKGVFASGCFVTGARVTRPDEQWSLAPMLLSEAEGFLVRNADHLEQCTATGKPCVGDFSLNVANPIAAGWYRARWGLAGVTASYDLAADQLLDLLQALPRGAVEVTLHQHMPMFHMEYCVFCKFLSDGHNFTDCGRPCEKHEVELEDRSGARHVLKADLGCRNTLFNSKAQTGSEHFSRLLAAGCDHFRVELLQESGEEADRLAVAYRELLDGRRSGAALWRDLRLASQLGVTRGTLQDRPTE
eukprot:EG_transcript_1209